MADPNKVYSALLAAQKEMGPLLKTETNPHYKSKYANLAGVIETISDALHNNGLVVIQTTELDDRGEVVLVTTLAHESGDTISGRYPLRTTAKDDPQKLGGAMTYGRRYALMAIVGIAPEDDDGNAASSRDVPFDFASTRGVRTPATNTTKKYDGPKNYENMKGKKASPAQAKFLSGLMEQKLGATKGEPQTVASQERWGKKPSELDMAQVSQWIDELQLKPDGGDDDEGF